MRTLRVSTVIALVGIGVVIGYFSAQSSVSAASDGLAAQDYADIQQLYWRYNHGADFRDSDLFVSAFADDVVFRAGGLEITGKDELTAWRGERNAGETGDNGRRHWNSSYRITPSSEGAEGRVYWLLIDVSSGQPQHLASGYYDDVYEKTSDGWRIKRRILHSDAG